MAAKTGTSISPELSHFFAWWGRELRGLVRSNPRGPEYAKRRMVVSLTAQGVRWLEETDKKTSEAGPQTEGVTAPAPLRKLLQRATTGRRAVPLGIRLPKSTCFERRVTLPETARDDFARILWLDLTRVTPFKPEDVYIAFCEDNDAVPVKGKVALCQFIVKRPFIDEPRRALEGQGLNVSFADCWDQSGDTAIKLNFLSPQGREVPPPLRSSNSRRLLAVLALMLAGSAAYLAMQRSEAALAALDTQIAEAKSRAQIIRQTIDQANAAASEAAALQRLRTRAIAPMTVLHELTRLLPDDAYLTELRISGATVAMSGLAAKAVALLPVIDKSDVFEAVQITAPVLFEAALNKEQFRIEAHVTGAAEPATNAQAEQP